MSRGTVKRSPPLGDEFFKRKAAEKMADMREKARRRRRIPYDCMNAVVVGGEVVCKLGYRFPPHAHSKKTSMPLLTVLRGRSNIVCQKCRDYDGEECE